MGRDAICEERNGVHLYRTETLVYEDDTWGIIRDDEPGCMTYATHRCINAVNDGGYIGYGEYCWIDESQGIKQEKCSSCAEDVPEHIVTLVRIHNWKR